MGLLSWLFGRRAPEPSPPPAVVAPGPAPAPEPAVAEREPRPGPLPEAAAAPGWRASCDDGILAAIDPSGTRFALPVAQIHALAIEGSDAGEALSQWWTVYGPEEDLAFAFPLDAAGSDAVAARLAALPGFRAELLAAARAATDLDTVVIWQRPTD